MKSPSPMSIYAWRPAAWLRVRGEDAPTFLQGQFTNDLRGLESGQWRYGLWLNVKGKIQADSFVFAGDVPGEFWIGSYFSPAQAIRERLESYIIADDVILEDLTDQWSAISAFGPDADKALTEIRADVSETAAPAGYIYRGRRERDEHAEWIYPAAIGPRIEETTRTCPKLHESEIERRRIEAGIAAVPADAGPNDLPNEAGLDAEAISFTKGCYLGQEIMARLKSMGQVRRRLLRVVGPAPIPAALPAPMFVGDRQVGEIRSVAPRADGQLIGLAMLSTLHVPGGAKLALAPNAFPAWSVAESP